MRNKKLLLFCILLISFAHAFSVNERTFTQLPWIEDFSSWPPQDWTLSGPRSWAAHSNSGSAFCMFFGWQDGYAEMISPPIVLNGDTSLSFRWSHRILDSADDSLVVSASTDMTNWTTLWQRSGTQFDSQDGAQYMSPGTFVEELVSLSDFSNQTLYIKFKGISGYGPNLYIDDVSISPTGSTPDCITSYQPADGTDNLLPEVTLSWSAPSNTSSYMLYVGDSSENYNILNGLVITETSYNCNLSAGNTYYWKVAPGNDNGYSTNCTEWSFSTISNPPQEVMNSNPTDGEIDVVDFGTLSWDASYSALGYNVYLGSSSGNYNVINGSTVTETSIDYSGLQYGADYYWKVVPFNDIGSTVNCTERVFTVRSDPTITQLPWIEDFSSWPPQGWTLSGPRSWAAHSNSGSAFCMFFGWQDGYAEMTSPPIQIQDTGYWSISFDWSHESLESHPNDELRLELITQDGNIVQLFSFTGEVFDSNDGAGYMQPGFFVSENIPLDSFSGQTVTFRFTGTSGFGPNLYIDNVSISNYTPPQSYAKVNVLLEGALNDDQTSMTTFLPENNHLPHKSSYPDSTFARMFQRNHVSEIVDWMKLELRATIDGPTIEEFSVLLRNDGRIVDYGYPLNNSLDYVKFYNIPPGQYYIILRHRNHIDIISSIPVSLNSQHINCIPYDFTNDATSAYTSGPPPLKALSSGLYAMYAGDVNSDGTIISSDLSEWKSAFEAGYSDGYHKEDLDFDASVLSRDASIWTNSFENQIPDSQVPNNTTDSNLLNRSQ